MKKMNSPSKSVSLLKKISAQDVIREEKLLTDNGLLELFSWHTKRSPRARIKDTLATLVKQGDLRLGRLGEDRIYTITAAGQGKMGRPSLQLAPPPQPANWNQRWYFITYQIPDSHKVARNQLLIALRKLGARRYSAALWIYPYDISNQVKKIATYYQVAQYLLLLRADTISNDAAWRKRFHLR